MGAPCARDTAVKLVYYPYASPFEVGCSPCASACACCSACFIFCPRIFALTYTPHPLYVSTSHPV